MMIKKNNKIKMEEETPIFNCEFKAGDRVRVDKGKPNSCEVTIKALTPQKMYATVRADDGYEWTTMSTRLSAL